MLGSGNTVCVPGPSAPTGLIAVAGNGQVLVSFEAANTNGGPAISSYTVTSNPGGFTASGSASPLVVSSLSNGVAYTFTVVATNANGSSPASAAVGPVTPSAAIPNGSFQATFLYTAAAQSFTVPAGITSLNVDLYGAQGGSGNLANSGGLGGRVQGTLAVSGGLVLAIYVGGQGQNYPGCSPCIGGGGGWNGGGGPSSSNAWWGGGGGGTDLRIGGTTLSDRVMVAGGGAGGRNGPPNTGAHGGGLTGAHGNFVSGGPGAGKAGGGGGQTSGGSAGCWWSGSGCGGAGQFGIGGDRGSSSGTYGTPGGGGWYGGGGGTDQATGGGGSSYTHATLVTSVTHTQGARSGNGQVIITMTP